MIEGRVLRYVGGTIETVRLTVLSPDLTSADGRPCHLVSPGLWGGGQPWARGLFERWGFARLGDDESARAQPGLAPGRRAEVWAEPEEWPEGVVELATATVAFRGKVATVVVARSARE